MGKSPKNSRTQFLIGIGLACCIGVTNGSFIVPMKYAQKDVHGIIYVLSFGIGAELVRNIFLDAVEWT